MTKEVSRYRAFYELATAEAKTQQANPLQAVDFAKYKSHVSSEGALKKIAELEVREEKRRLVREEKTWGKTRGRRKEEGGRRKEEGGRRKEEGGRREGGEKERRREGEKTRGKRRQEVREERRRIWPIFLLQKLKKIALLSFLFSCAFSHGRLSTLLNLKWFTSRPGKKSIKLLVTFLFFSHSCFCRVSIRSGVSSVYFGVSSRFVSSFYLVFPFASLCSVTVQLM
jgi:hypothetical protein